MLVIEDFTKLSEGVRVPTDGRVTRCPRCGRNGVRRKRLDGTIRYVHVQTSEIFGDGLRAEPSDCCTLMGDPAGAATEASPDGSSDRSPAPPTPER